MIPFDNCFDYVSMDRESTDKGRVYLTPDGDRLPSVTTILDKTKDKTFLIEWRKRVGEANAALITKQAAAIGTIMHDRLEQYILGQELKFGSNHIYQMAKLMTKNIIANGLINLSKVYCIEKPLYVPGLYAGTVDLVAQKGDSIVIVDYKNSIKIKKEEWVEDYRIQLIAYMMAHDAMFGTKIRHGIIMMSARPVTLNVIPEYKEFYITPDNYDKYYGMWLDKLSLFYSKQ